MEKVDMSKQTAKKQTFSIMVKAILEFNIDVVAESLEDAVAQAKDLKIGDIDAALPADGYNDYSIDVQGVFRND